MPLQIEEIIKPFHNHFLIAFQECRKSLILSTFGEAIGLCPRLFATELHLRSKKQHGSAAPQKVIHMDRQCPGGRVKLRAKSDEKGLMSNKEQFLAFVLVGAMAQDLSTKSNDCPLIMHMAGQIPEDRIPDNVMNAAKVFLAFCNGVCKRPHDWMLARN